MLAVFVGSIVGSDGIGHHLLRHEKAYVLGAPVDDVRAEGEDVLVRDLELLFLFSFLFFVSMYTGASSQSVCEKVDPGGLLSQAY